MSRTTYASACAAYGAWLGAMLERHARGKRLHPKPWDGNAVDDEARSFGVPYGREIDHGGPTAEARWFWTPRHEPGIDVLVRRVAGAVRGARYEDPLLSVILLNCPATPPADVVNDLIDRAVDECVTILGHAALEDAELWRLVDLVPEAGQTLVLRRSVDPGVPAERLEEAFTQLRQPWLARWLAEYGGEPSSPEKVEIVASWMLVDAAARGEMVEVRRICNPAVAEAIARLQRGSNGDGAQRA